MLMHRPTQCTVLCIKVEIDRIFQTIRILALDPNKRPTTRMQLLKVIELRARHWDVEQRTEKQQVCSDDSSPDFN